MISDRSPVQVCEGKLYLSSSRWQYISDHAKDLVRQMLTLSSEERITVEEALAHKYMTTYYEPKDEPVYEKPFTFDMEFDDLPTLELKTLVFKEALHFKKEQITETHFP